MLLRHGLKIHFREQYYIFCCTNYYKDLKLYAYIFCNHSCKLQYIVVTIKFEDIFQLLRNTESLSSLETPHQPYPITFFYINSSYVP